jgi:predicted RNA binding protein YcfA (HicA-like mRNA interferase family)
VSKLDKLIAHLRSEPSEASFSDIKRILEAFDFVEVRSSGSHHIFRHQDSRQITIPKDSGRKVKKIYIKKVTNLLGLDDYGSN